MNYFRKRQRGPLSQKFPPALAHKHLAFPLRQDGRKLHVAMASPYDPEHVDPIGFATSLRVVPYIAPELRLLFYHERRYGIAREARYIRVSQDFGRGRPPAVDLPSPAPEPAGPGKELFGEIGTGNYLTDESDDLYLRAGGALLPEPKLEPVLADRARSHADRARSHATSPAVSPAVSPVVPPASPVPAAVPSRPPPSAAAAMPVAPRVPGPVAPAVAPARLESPGERFEPPASKEPPAQKRPEPPPVSQAIADPDSWAFAVEEALREAKSPPAPRAPPASPPPPGTPNAPPQAPPREETAWFDDRPKPTADSGSEPVVPRSLQSIQAALLSAPDQKVVAEALLGYCAGRFPRAFLAVVRHGVAVGWRGLGKGLEGELGKIRFSPRDSSVFRTALSRRGPVLALGPTSEVDRAVWAALGEAPAHALVIAVELRGRPVNFLFVDCGSAPPQLTAPEELGRVADLAARAYERLIVEKKGRGRE